MPVSWLDIQERNNSLERSAAEIARKKDEEQRKKPPVVPSPTPQPKKTEYAGVSWDQVQSKLQGELDTTGRIEQHSNTHGVKDTLSNMWEDVKAVPGKIARGAQVTKEAVTGAVLRGAGSTATGISGVVGVADPLVAAVTPGATTKDVRESRFRGEEWIENLVQDAAPYTESTRKAMESGDITPGLLAEKGLDVATSLTKFAGVSVATGGLGGIAMIVAEEGGNARRESLKRLRDRSDLTDSEKEIIATTSGTAVAVTSAVLERLPVGQLGNKFGMKVANNLQQRVLKRLLTNPLTGASAEAIEEMAVGQMTDTARYILENDKDAFDGAIRRRLEEGLSGLAGFGMARGAIGTVSAAGAQSARQYNAKVDKIHTEISRVGSSAEGREALRQLSHNPSPSRKDLKNAGLQIKMNINAEERRAIAQAANPDIFDTNMHLLRKLAGQAKTPVQANELDRQLAVQQAEKGDLRTLKNMGLDKHDVIDIVKNQWLSEDRAKQKARIGGKKDLTEPEITKKRAKTLEQLDDWDKSVDADLEVQKAEETLDGPRESLKPVTPPIARHSDGSLNLSNFTWDNMKAAPGHIADMVMTPHMKNKGKAIANWIRGEFRQGGVTLPDITMQRNLMDRKLAARSASIGQSLVDYQDAAKKAAGIDPKDGVPERIADQVDRYLKGAVENQDLPVDVRVPAKVLREQIDSLSKEALDSGAITGGQFLGSTAARSAFFTDLRQAAHQGMIHEDLVQWIMDEGKTQNTPIDPKMAGTVASILRNDTFYITRTFDAFEMDGWKERMPDSVKNDMAKMLRDEDNTRRARIMKINEARQARGKEELPLNPAITDREIQIKMNKILNDAATADDQRVFVEGKLGRQNRNTLKQRKNLEKTYREFLGEVRDPMENALKTAVKLHSLIEKFNFTTRLREVGLGEFLFENQTDAPHEMAVTQIAKEGDIGMEPIAGLWTTPEVYEMFQDQADAYESMPRIMKALYWVDTKSQRAKTAWSVQSHMRQVVGNPMMLMANGNWKHIAPFLRQRPSTYMTAMFGRGTKEQRAYYNRAVELGLAGQGVDYGMFKKWAHKKSTVEEIMTETLGKNIGGKMNVDQVGAKLRKQYGYEDTMYKLMAFEAEKAKYEKAKAFDTSTEAGRVALEEHAATIVRDTNPSYDQLPMIINHIRAVPGFGMFMAFPASQVVNAVNRAGLTTKEIFNKNPDPVVRRKIRAIGMKRAASQMLMYSSPYILEAASAAATGISDEERKAFRKSLAPWARFAPLLFFGRDSQDKIRYINLGFVDPHSYFTQPMRALLEGASEGEYVQSMARATMQVFEPYIQETMGASALFDIMRNTTRYGGDIWDELDNGATKWELGLKHAIRGTILPGTAISAERIYKGATGQVSKGGKSYNAMDEIASVSTGFKVEEFNIKQGFGFEAYRAKAGLDSARKVIYRLNSEGNIPEGQQRDTVERYDHIHEQTILNAHEAYENYRQLHPDIDKGYLYESLGRLGVSNDVIDQIYTGVPEKQLPPTLKVTERMISLANDPERLNELIAHRETKLNDFAYRYGEEAVDSNSQKLQQYRRELDAYGIGGKEMIRRATDQMNVDQLERYVSDIKKKVGGKYSDTVIRKAAVMKQRLQGGFKWTKSRRMRAARIAQRMGLSEQELSEAMKGVSP